jgi:hypothetical protein
LIASLQPTVVDFRKSRGKDFTVAEINKLSVGKVLDKLRSTDVPKSKITRLKEKNESLDEEIQRLKAARRRPGWGRGTSSTGRD